MVEKTDDHWLWTGGKSECGFGRFHPHPSTYVPANRYSWELVNGPVDSDELVIVACRNRACVNPRHLALGTHKDHVHAGNSPCGINARKTHCVHGHEFTPENTMVYKSGGQKGGRRCRECARLRQEVMKARYRKSDRKPKPTATVLKRLVYSGKSWREIALDYGVTDTAVRKWAKGYELLAPFGR